jgi:hypothetical protein
VAPLAALADSYNQQQYNMLCNTFPAGTEDGITEPEATFSACFGGAFLMWHPMKYASMLAEKMQQHGTHAWLVNTGAPSACINVEHNVMNVAGMHRVVLVLQLNFLLPIGYRFCFQMACWQRRCSSTAHTRGWSTQVCAPHVFFVDRTVKMSL